MLLNVWFSSFCNRLEKVTDENERISEELKFKEQKVQSLQRRLVQNISYPDICFDLKTYRFFLYFLELRVTTRPRRFQNISSKGSYRQT